MELAKELFRYVFYPQRGYRGEPCGSSRDSISHLNFHVAIVIVDLSPSFFALWIFHGSYHLLFSQAKCFNHLEDKLLLSIITCYDPTPRPLNSLTSGLLRTWW